MYRVVIKREDHLLMRLLKVRVVVNGKEIYYLEKNNPVIISFDYNNPKIVVTDGYHISKPLELVYHQMKTYYFRVDCALSDIQLFYGFFLWLVLFVLAIISNSWTVRFISYAPLLFIIYSYYIRRKSFLQIHPM